MLVPSQYLDKVSQPWDRWQSPLSDEAARKLGDHFGMMGVAETVSRTRTRAMNQLAPKAGSGGDGAAADAAAAAGGGGQAPGAASAASAGAKGGPPRNRQAQQQQQAKPSDGR